ncbi:MAG TPA: HigA family addiction module antitoxin [Thermoanaerobaculia bacterium]|jgi:addiction module HigA family antidote|nr:HigA family addiction module antitoxin [Thermoanaerobaculia bacterium]
MAEYAVRRPLKRGPTHPGTILREDTLPALGLNISEAARQLRVSRQMLHSILAERSGVSPEMALRLGRFCGNGAAFWLRLQANHDLWRAEQELRAELQKIPEHSAA